MAEDKNSSSQQSSQSKNGRKDAGNENIKGRVQGSQNPNYENEGSQADISNVDQQEGNMNHGTVGGNLHSSEKGTE